MNSIKQVRDQTMISVPNKISEHNAWGFQLIKVRENKMIQPQFCWVSPGLEKGPYQVTSMSFR